MDALRKDHHFVPKLYLKQWARDGAIAAYGLLVPHERVPLWKNHSLKGIAYREHLYTQIVGGIESDEFERWLDRNFEAAAEPAIMRAVTDQRLRPDDWRAIVRFAFAQDVRTPRRLKEFLQRQTVDLPEMLKFVVESAVQEASADRAAVMPGKTMSASGFPLKIEIKHQPDGTGLLKTEAVVGRSMWIWTLKQLLTATIHKVSYKGWSVLKAAKGCSWPTSDNPLIRLNYMDERSYNFEGGWGVPNGDILLPLSPTHVLHRCAGRRPLPRNSRLDSATSETIKRIIIEHADRYVFATDEFEVHKIRVRRVDRTQYMRERDDWARWHAEQTAAELTA